MFGVEKDAEKRSFITNVQSKDDKLLREKLCVCIDEDKDNHTVLYIDRGYD